MGGNTFGHTFRLTTFGESHGVAIGGVIDGVPANFSLDLELVQKELDRRKPGQSSLVSQRKESDTVQFLSGIFEGKTTGAPIGFIIQNEDAKSKDYSHLKENYRPSHADFVYDKKYGFRDYRGGGRSSARETACRVVAGAIAKQFLAHLGISINAFVDQVGNISIPENTSIDFSQTEANPSRCPHPPSAEKMEALIREIRKSGDTIGGAIRCIASGVPVGLGEPVFDKLHAELGKAMLSINAVRGFEIGSGFGAASMRGSEHNDIFVTENETLTNHSGGIQGGLSNGQPITFRVAFKPVATIMKPQESINQIGEKITLEAQGRHDPCVVPRAVPIVEAMCALVLLDFYLRNKCTLL